MADEPGGAGGIPLWVVATVVSALTAGAAWWILPSDPDPGPTAQASPPAPCSARSSAAGPFVGGPSDTPDWEIAVTGVRAAPSVPAPGDSTFRAAPGEVFVVVEVRFSNLHPGREAALSTGAAALECEDGTRREVAGFDGGRGFCRVCALDLGTEQKHVRWTFLFRMERGDAGQRFTFRYGEAQPIPFIIAGSDG
jgi:hypothetical protein